MAGSTNRGRGSATRGMRVTGHENSMQGHMFRGAGHFTGHVIPQNMHKREVETRKTL